LHQPDGGVPIKRWTRGVAVEDAALRQLENVARMPFIHRWVAAMPDVHWGMGATVGSVIPTVGAIIPAAVGVDIGCGMMASRDVAQGQRPADSLAGRARGDREGRAARAQRQPRRPRQGRVGRPAEGRRSGVARASQSRFDRITAKHPAIEKSNTIVHLGTLGTGNHFIEVCLDERDRCGSCCTRARAGSATASARTSSPRRSRRWRSG
jgi:tRNA-splicing ligase RtcB